MIENSGCRIEHKLLTGLILMAPLLGAQAEIVTIGETADCDVEVPLAGDALQQAVQTGADGDAIHIAVAELATSTLISAKSLVIAGGFDSCADGEKGTRQDPAKQTRLTAASTASSTISVDGGAGLQSATPGSDSLSLASYQVRIQNVDISAGQAIIDAGGVNVAGAADVAIADSLLSGNSSDSAGGAIRVTGPRAGVDLTNTIIDGNGALNGGGIACEDNARLTIDQASVIKNNSASNTGGGLYLFACNFLGHGDIIDNRANLDGGGIYATRVSRVDLLGLSRPLLLQNNRADADENGSGNGGGIFLLESDTSLIADNVRMADNRAGGHGGAVAAIAGPQVRIQRDPTQACGGRECSFIQGNQAGFGSVNGLAGRGGAVYADGAKIQIVHTLLSGNDSANGGEALAYVTGTSSSLIIESSVVQLNGLNTVGESALAHAGSGATLQVGLSIVAANAAALPLFSVDESAQLLVLTGSVIMGSEGAGIIHPTVNAGEIIARTLIVQTGAQIPIIQGEAEGITEADDDILVAAGNNGAALTLDDKPEVRDIAADVLSVAEYEPLSPFDWFSGQRDLDDPAATNGDGTPEQQDFTLDIGPNEFGSQPLLGGGSPAELFGNGFETDETAPPDLLRFTELLDGVFDHPRCTTCHLAIREPAEVNARFAHTELTCTGGCHVANGGPDLDLTDWHAPRDQRLHGLTSRQRCNIARRDPELREVDARDHLTRDVLILWAATRGDVPGGGASNGQTVAATDLTVEQWVEHVNRWFDDGALCQ